MLSKRIIPCLDVKDGRVVKGTNFVGLRDAGDPVELAHRYDEERADELVFLDITASSDQRKTTVDMARSCASQVFIPFTIGGGIRSVEDMRAMLKAGADKTSLNTAAIKNPELIREGAAKFGSQCVVLAVDARRNGEHSWEVYINGVPSSVAFTEDTSDAGKRQNAAQLEKLASWLQDNDPDLYACYKETNNTKKIKMLQQWAASNDPDLIYWADISKDLWWVMLWNEVNASYWKAQNQVLKSMGMPAAYPEKEPTFSNTLFKEIVSHKYGIIW